VQWCGKAGFLNTILTSFRCKNITKRYKLRQSQDVLEMIMLLLSQTCAIQGSQQGDQGSLEFSTHLD
jgi:hypothetical protein